MIRKPVRSCFAALMLVSVAHAQVVITEIMYHAADFQSESNASEYIEIFNYSDEPIDLEGWQILDEKYLAWKAAGNPLAGIYLPDKITDDVISGGANEGDPSILLPGEVAVIIPESRGIFAFRESWQLDSSIKIIAPNWRSFENYDAPSGTFNTTTNKITPADSEPSVIHLLNAKGEVVDLVNYFNGYYTNLDARSAEWPNTGRLGYSTAKGGSIYLLTAAVTGTNPTAANDSGKNWSLSISGEDGAYNQLASGFTYSSRTVGSPGFIWDVTVIPVPEPAALGLILGLASVLGLRRRR